MLGFTVGYFTGHKNTNNVRKANKVAQTAIVNAVKSSDSKNTNPIAKKLTLNATGINIGSIVITTEITKIDGSLITTTASSGDIYTFNTNKNTLVFNNLKKKITVTDLAINNVIQINAVVLKDGSLQANNISILN